MTAIALVTATLALALLAASWRRRAALSGIAASAAVALAGVAAVRGGTGGPVLIALVLTIIGGILLGLGQAVQRLLDDDGL